MNQTKIKRVTSFFNEDKSRYSILTVISISILLLGITIYNSINNPSPGAKGYVDQWKIWISFISAVFGMMNVTTYSIMDLDDKEKRNKYRIFIVFNTIAVTTLAAVNFSNSLWILGVENVLFFFTGCYQFYNWFLKEQKENKKEESFGFKRLTSEDGFIIFSAVLLAALFITIISRSFGTDTMNTNNAWLWKNAQAYLWIRTILDAILGVAGMLGAFMVARRRFFSIVIYIFSNTMLIGLWTTLLVLSQAGSDEFVSHSGVSLVQSINMIGLFVFYNITNILLIGKWGKALEPKKKKTA